MVQRQRGGQSCLGGEWTPRLVRMHAEAPLHLIVAFCKGSEQVQRYSRVLCSSCLLAVSMLLFHFFSCSSCTLLEKCHRFFLFFFFLCWGLPAWLLIPAWSGWSLHKHSPGSQRSRALPSGALRWKVLCSAADLSPGQ